MSYAIRNTIILLVTLSIIVGIGFAFSKFYLDAKIESETNELSNKRNDLNSKQNINTQFDELNSTYEVAVEIMANYNKILYPSNKPDDVYDFLTSVNDAGGNIISFDYMYSDSLPNSDYGIIQSSIAGFGPYNALTDFVNRIENSQLLNKVIDLTIAPARQEEDQNMVNFSFELESYYEKTLLLDSTGTDLNIILDENISSYNPLYPLIQESVRPNLDGLPDIRSSRLIGMTDSRIFIRTQLGEITSLKVGDRVYLGSLTSIDLQSRTASFNLNIGGIQEVVTLEVVR